jgi:hypothetical protein
MDNFFLKLPHPPLISTLTLRYFPFPSPPLAPDISLRIFGIEMTTTLDHRTRVRGVLANITFQP